MTMTPSEQVAKSYDCIAEAYLDEFGRMLDSRPFDRAFLTAFAETVRNTSTDSLVIEVGSGPGTVAAFLTQSGLTVRGIDISPKMVQLATSTHPEIPFSVGDMRSLQCVTESFDGLVAWYSLIHVAKSERAVAIAEFHRVLRPSGYLLLAFQVGDETRHLDSAFGQQVDLDFHRLDPDDVCNLLAEAGFDVLARMVQAPDASSIAAQIPQGYVFARKAIS